MQHILTDDALGQLPVASALDKPTIQPQLQPLRLEANVCGLEQKAKPVVREDCAFQHYGLDTRTEETRHDGGLQLEAAVRILETRAVR